MKKVIFFLFLFLVSANFVIAQAPGIQWERNIGGDNEEQAQSVIFTKDRGYIIAGNSKIKGLYGSADYLVVKLDEQGVMQWQKTYGGNGDDIANSIWQTFDGGYVVAGYTQSNNNGIHNYGQKEWWIIKIDSLGILEWQKSFGGKTNDEARSIQQTSDSGYIVAGWTGSGDGDVSNNHGAYDCWVIKLDKLGNLEWEETYGGYDYEVANSIDQTADGGYIIAGYTDTYDNFGQRDLWVVKLDSAGVVQWKSNYGGNGQDVANAIKENKEGGYVVGGYSTSYDRGIINKGQTDCWLLKLDSIGVLQWQKSFGGSSIDQINDVLQTSDSGYITAGYLEGGTALVVKFDADGQKEWEKDIDNFSIERFYSIAETTPGKFISAGYLFTYDSPGSYAGENSDFYVVKLGNVDTIFATAFYDHNNNGLKDNGERLFSYGKISILKEGIDSFDQENDLGTYTIEVDTGKYISSFHPFRSYYKTIPSYHSTYFPSYESSDNITFAVQPIDNKTDVEASVFPLTIARTGFPLSYKITYQNTGTSDIVAGKIKFIKDARLNIVNSQPNFSSINGDTLFWEYNTLQSLDTSSIVINFLLTAPPYANIGDTLHSFLSVNVVGDITPSNNADTLNQIVRSSFDPNDKTENHAESISKSNVVNGDWLTYTIRFQNTGTDTAFTILVRDTLDSNLDWNSLEMIDASHDYQLNITDGNKCAWFFSNVLLPDSNVNETASHGYIVYRIKPKTTLVVGDVITNTASIYFDYNLPIQTNTEKTIVANDVVLPLQLLSFSANHKGKANLLKWSTAQELNTDRFEIERSINSRDFVSIGSVRSLNNGKNKNEYIFTDAQPLKQINYYRLKMLDKDGRYTYSAIKSVNNSGIFDVTLYPNPVKQNLTLTINAEKDMDVLVEIVNAEGTKMYAKKMQIPYGASIQSINVATFKAGNYFLKCITTDGQTGLKFVKY